MNKVREFYNKDKYYTDEECNYINVLGLALLLKRNNISKITARKYEDFEHLITKDNSKENELAKKIIDSMLTFIGNITDMFEKEKNITPLFIYDNIEKCNKEISETYAGIWTFDYFIDQSIEISKFSEKDIIEEITRPLDDYIIEDYNDSGDFLNEDISKLMVKVLDIEKNRKIAVLDIDYDGNTFNNNGIIESQIILQTQNSNIDSYCKTEKLNREIREYAIKTTTKHISKNLFTEDITEKYDYIFVYPEILNATRLYYFNLDKPIFKDLNINQYKNNISVSSIMALKIIESLKNTGKGIIAFSLASLSNISERKIRQKLIENNYIETVIKLNDCMLVIIRKNKEDENIEFVDLDKYIVSKEYNYTYRTRTSINIKEAMQNYNKNAVIVSKNKIIENNYSLNPDIYTKSKLDIKNAVKLEIVLDSIFRGYQASKEEVRKMKVQEQQEATYTLLEIGNINDYGEISSSLTLIDPNKIGKRLDRYLLKSGDIVITARGKKIKLSFIELKENEKIIANGSINVIRVDKNKMNPRYLKMFLDSPKGKQTLENIKIGREKTPSLNTGDLKKIEIPCPSLEEQNAVAKKYEEIEQRISKLKDELNNIINNF